MGMVILAVVLPGQYGKRQRRLEMQYQARQEIARRQVEGTGALREPGEEGSAAPPVPGELIIPLWPLLTLLGLLFAFSAAMLLRARSPRSFRARQPNAERDR